MLTAPLLLIIRIGRSLEQSLTHTHTRTYSMTANLKRNMKHIETPQITYNLPN